MVKMPRKINILIIAVITLILIGGSLARIPEYYSRIIEQKREASLKKKSARELLRIIADCDVLKWHKAAKNELATESRRNELYELINTGALYFFEIEAFFNSFSVADDRFLDFLYSYGIKSLDAQKSQKEWRGLSGGAYNSLRTLLKFKGSAADDYINKFKTHAISIGVDEKSLEDINSTIERGRSGELSDPEPCIEAQRLIEKLNSIRH